MEERINRLEKDVEMMKEQLVRLIEIMENTLLHIAQDKQEKKK